MKYTDFIKQLISIGAELNRCAYTLSKEEREQALELALDHSAVAVVEAWRLFQEARPGQPFVFFQRDLPKYIWKARQLAAEKDREPITPEMRGDICDDGEDFLPKAETAARLQNIIASLAGRVSA